MVHDKKWFQIIAGTSAFAEQWALKSLAQPISLFKTRLPIPCHVQVTKSPACAVAYTTTSCLWLWLFVARQASARYNQNFGISTFRYSGYPSRGARDTVQRKVPEATDARIIRNGFTI